MVTWRYLICSVKKFDWSKSDEKQWLWTFSILWPYIFQNSYAWYAWVHRATSLSWSPGICCARCWLHPQFLTFQIDNRLISMGMNHAMDHVYIPLCLFLFLFFTLFFQCDYHFKIFLIDFKPFKTGQSPHESTWSPFPPTARVTVLDSIPRHRDNSTSEREHRSCRAAQPGVPYFRRLGNLGKIIGKVEKMAQSTVNGRLKC